jgi:hypothetical protein
MTDPSDADPIENAYAALDTPELRAAFRAARAYYLDPVTDCVPPSINPRTHCIYVRVHPDHVMIGVASIASIASIAPHLPPPCVDEIKHHAAQRILVHVFEDVDRGAIKLVHAGLQTVTVPPGGDA